jgi:Tfp pilus assembly major pilin PilA
VRTRVRMVERGEKGFVIIELLILAIIIAPIV